MTLGGFGNGAAIVANITIVQRGAPDRVRGRAFTLVISANYAVLGIALFAFGPVTNSYGARWTYAAACATLVVAAAVATRYARALGGEFRRTPGKVTEVAP
jgi:MFS family permease